MVRSVFVLSVVTILTHCVGPVAAQPTSEKGQIQIGVHEVAMKAGHLYMIKVTGRDFQPHVVMKPGSLISTSFDFSKPNQFNANFLSTKNETHTIYIAPELFSVTGKGPFTYQFEVTPLKVAAKPVLEVKGQLADTDPQYKTDFLTRAHHKAHKIKLEKGQFYIIDMTSPDVPNRLDSYLYLLDSTAKVIRSDDDGGGFPNARIVYQAEKADDYTIITTGLGNALGDFTLTVRTTEKE